MSVFVEQTNGSIRRIRGTFGGNQAWKQHDGCHCDSSNSVCKCDNSRRAQLRNQLVEALAMEELHAATAPGGRKDEKRRVGHGIKSFGSMPVQSPRRSQHQRPFRTAPVDLAPDSTLVPNTMVSVPKPRAPRPRLKVIITETGKMVAVHVN